MWTIQPFLHFCDEDQGSGDEVIQKQDGNALDVLLCPLRVSVEERLKHA